MKELSIGKFYGLQHVSSRRGTFTCLALDHRHNLRRALNPDNPNNVPDADLIDFKMMAIRALASESTAVLLDPEYSAAHAVAGGVIPKNIGLVVALEATGYTGDSKARQSRILPGWGVEKAKRMGADAVKLLVYYHPDADNASETEDFIEGVSADCKAQDLLLMLEPLIYSPDDNKVLEAEDRRDAIAETARRLTPLGIDILKTEFPLDDMELNRSLWLDACKMITTASVVPWILLSAAVDFEKYLDQVTTACKAGASGIAVGRAVWKEAVSMKHAARNKFLETTGRERLILLNKLCDAQAKPYTDYYMADAPPDWYRRYGDAN
jgi:tagatose 1,6-diphosphate aldolase